MQCSKCNNVINEGQEVCLNCGHILGYESEVSKHCIHCSREIPIAYKKCPYCRKKQKSRRARLSFIIIFFSIFITGFSLSIIYSPSNIIKKNEYIKDCLEVEYEDLVRKSDYYDEALVKVSGKVLSVESISSIMKSIKIKIYVDNNKDYIIEGTFYNKELTGFIKNDEIIIYGKYKKLKGNTPFISIEYIDLKKTTTKS